MYHIQFPFSKFGQFSSFQIANFKLSVSNPTNKYVACLSVLSQISNCQGVGRKSKFEILKTYRNIVNLIPGIVKLVWI